MEARDAGEMEGGRGEIHLEGKMRERERET